MPGTTAGSEKTGGGASTCASVTVPPRRLPRWKARRAARCAGSEPSPPTRIRTPRERSATAGLATALPPAGRVAAHDGQDSHDGPVRLPGRFRRDPGREPTLDDHGGHSLGTGRARNLDGRGTSLVDLAPARGGFGEHRRSLVGPLSAVHGPAAARRRHLDDSPLG